MSKCKSHIVPLLFLFAALPSKVAFSNPVAFAKGDASFVGVVDRQSDFMKEGVVIDAAKLFCCAQYLDYTLGTQLDVSQVPVAQLKAVRNLIDNLLAVPQKKAVLLCVTDSRFDFETTWLGVPYNQTKFRLSSTDWMANCFGPTGASSLSIRDAGRVPPLLVEIVNDERFRVIGQCCFCVLTIDNTIFQAVRHVVSHDGVSRTVDFRYDPKARVCFEEGDAFFVANAKPFFEVVNNSVELQYPAFPRRTFSFNGLDPENAFALSENEIRKAALDLTLLPKGRRLTLRNVPDSISNWLKMPEGEQVWYVFVVAKNFDATRHQLGLRYNANPFDKTNHPFPEEFVECNHCAETYPSKLTSTGNAPEWPTPLPVTWKGDDAFADMKDLQLVFARYWENVPFYNDQVHKNQFRLKNNQVEHWVNRKLIRTFSP